MISPQARKCRPTYPVLPLTEEQQSLYMANTRLVHAFLRKRGVHRLTQLWQEQLTDAAFDGYLRACQLYRADMGAFSTYATFWLRSGLNHALDRLTKEKRRGTTHSLHALYDDDDGYDPEANTQDVPTSVANRELIEQCARHLPPKHYEILVRLHLKGWSRAAVGVFYGLSKERVRQVEQDALIRLRMVLRPRRRKESGEMVWVQRDLYEMLV